MQTQQQTTTSRISQLLEKYQRVRHQTVSLCKPLKTEDYVVQPVVDVSPPKWHLGHTTWFFEALVLEKYCKSYKICDADYGYMFNSYYESVGERLLRPNRGFMTRPTIEEVYHYRNYVDQQMEAFLHKLTEDDSTVLNVIEIGLHHEQQHQELLVTDIKYILGHNTLFPPYQYYDHNDTLIEIKPAGFLKVEEGTYQIGHQTNDFCYDNELGVHKVFLHSFGIMDRLVINAEYLEFIESGGYGSFEWWLSEGWDWVKNSDIKAPHYWHLINSVWHAYTMGGFKKINPSEPVTHISYFEADAFARWKGWRLPTEIEWEVACKNFSSKSSPEANFVEEMHFKPVALSNGNQQFFGDCWEWTNSAYLPYPYFTKEAGALGEYNGKFMINQMVLRGGSCATPRDHIRSTYRNFFHPHLRWQFTGIRLAKHL
ncbi:MAG: ergothioneine biosynthesis protein EgtB [Bacteroidetes bacterium]|nr:ergothioneine biosynthesis protein EgtB [Bacteroidota bacterium]MDA1120271.1 ergothioneine biosynthesis protein EgtB [Bacteroidota bacterium]